MKAAPELKTARLILRQPQMSDAAQIFERYASDPEVTRFMGWPRHRSIADTEGFLRFSAQEWDRWPAGPYLILSLADGELLGSTGFAFQTAREAMTGYLLARDAWGKGFATEALRAMVDEAARIGVTRLFAPCHVENRPSQRVLEKCQFVREDNCKAPVEFPNLEPGARRDVFHYALVLSPRMNPTR